MFCIRVLAHFVIAQYIYEGVCPVLPKASYPVITVHYIYTRVPVPQESVLHCLRVLGHLLYTIYLNRSLSCIMGSCPFILHNMLYKGLFCTSAVCPYNRHFVLHCLRVLVYLSLNNYFIYVYPVLPAEVCPTLPQGSCLFVIIHYIYIPLGVCPTMPLCSGPFITIHYIYTGICPVPH